MTSSVRSGYTCCGTADNTRDEFPAPNSRQIRSCVSRTASVCSSFSGRYPDKSSAVAPSETDPSRSSTTFANSRPRSRSFRDSRRSASTHPSAESTRQTEPVSLSLVDHGPRLWGLCLHCQSVFFPPSEYSPKLTFVLVSTEISKVSGSSAYFSRAALTLAKIASVSFVFFSGLPF